jgi:hypothetical protein
MRTSHPFQRTRFLTAILSGFLLYAEAASPANPFLRLSFDEKSDIPKKYILTDQGISGNGFLTPPNSKLPSRSIKALPSDDFSVSFWLKMKDLPAIGQWNVLLPATVFCLSSEDVNNGLVLRIVDKTFQLALLGDAKKYQTFTGSHEIPLRQWVNIAITYKGNTLEMKLNGTTDIRGTASMRAKVWKFLNLGHMNRKRPLTMGIIDEFELYGSALSSEQIKQIGGKYKDRGSTVFGKATTPQKNVTATPIAKPVSIPQCEDTFYKRLTVDPDTIHPLQEQVTINATVLDWNANNTPCLIMAGTKNGRLGSRDALFTPCAYDENNLPIYDTGKTLDFRGGEFQIIKHSDTEFDLVGSGKSVSVGGKHIVYYQNTGSIGHPRFAPPVPILVDGKSVADALGAPFASWYIGDVSGDETPDLLVTRYERENSNEKWPDGQSIWDNILTPNTGKGRGYSVNGKWLGKETSTTLFWAKGEGRSKDTLSFQSFKQVNYRYDGFAVQWKSEDGFTAIGQINVDNVNYLLLGGSIDQILAMPVNMNGEELFCDTAVPLLEPGVAVKNCYYFPNFSVYDIDADGHDEIITAGNNGRVAVLKGTAVGAFKEVEPLNMKGGDICVDTLAVPCRTDWNHDGLPDLLIGDSSGLLTFWPGTEDSTVYGAPVYMESQGRRIMHQAGETGSIQGPTERRWGYLNPTTGDWDGDGIQDIVAGDINSDLTLYKQIPDSKNLSAPEYFTINGQRRQAAWRVRPAILPASAKFHGIEYPTLLYADWGGFAAIAVPEELGSTTIKESIRLKYESGEDITLCAFEGLWGRVKLSTADWDEDGDWDIIYGSPRSISQRIFPDLPPITTVLFLENTGSSEAPVFKKPVMFTKTNGELIPIGVHVASVWPTDLNNDGHLDMIIGGENGKVYFFYRNELSWDE